jgi:DNA-binding transcriptional regulator LsrR (DeoR family)
MLLSQPMIRETHALAAQANITFVGIGDLGLDAPLVMDGFISANELKQLQRAGAVGEIVGWAFDAQGKFMDGLTNDRVASAPLPSRESSTVVAIAVGEKKTPGIRAALSRRLVNGIITDEATAEAILSTV